MRGETKMPTSTFRMPLATRTPKPAVATPAPATPASRLWLPLTGRP